MNIEYVGKCLLIRENDERILVVGDLHLGYEGSLRSGGVMVPIDLYKQVMHDFEGIFDKIGEEKIDNVKLNVGNISERETGYDNKFEGENKENKLDKIILLGDLKHEFGTIMREEWDYIGKTLVYLKKKCNELIVIEGNHDRILKPILDNVNAKGVDYFKWNGIGFMHGDKSFEEVEGKEVKYWIVGHGHPAISITDGTKKEKYKCFLEGSYGKIGNKKKIIVVPSFFPLIEGTDPRDYDMKFAWDFDLRKFDVKIVGENLEVLNFGKLDKL
jgi:uncharacterized protein